MVKGHMIDHDSKLCISQHNTFITNNPYHITELGGHGRGGPMKPRENSAKFFAQSRQLSYGLESMTNVNVT